MCIGKQFLECPPLVFLFDNNQDFRSSFEKYLALWSSISTNGMGNLSLMVILFNA
jgi:hypothetical protein